MSTESKRRAPYGAERAGWLASLDVARGNAVVAADAGGAVIGANAGTAPAVAGAVVAAVFGWVSDARSYSSRVERE